MQFFVKQEIENIVCGVNHVYVCTKDKKRYLFDSNGYRQCISYNIYDTKYKQIKSIHVGYFCTMSEHYKLCI